MSNRFQEYRVRPDRGSDLEVPHVLAGLVLLASIVFMVTPLEDDFWIGSLPGIEGQFWRVLVYAFTSPGLLSALISAVVLFLIARGLQSELGAVNLVGLFVLGGMGAATAHVWFGPAATLDGAICAVFAIFAGYAVIKYRNSYDIRGDIILITLLILWGIFGGGQTWIGQLAAVAVGAALGAAHAYGPWRGREQRVRLTALGIALACLGLVALKWYVLG